MGTGRSDKQQQAVGHRAQPPASKDAAAQFGPLRGTDWLELDHWAFQELPRGSYALFERIVRYHGVPVSSWLRRQDGGKSEAP